MFYKTDDLVATIYDYSPYGAVTVTGSAQPIQWSSECCDPELALTYYNYRHYNPLDGRWITRDPLGENGGVNMYAFVKNNAITQLDMLGRLPCPEGENVHIRIKPNSNPISHQYRTQKEVKNNPNKPNGCGIEGGVPIPETFPYVDEEGFFYPTPVVKSYSFTQACNNHDTCYGKCNSKQRNCDNQFLVDMIAQCENISNTEANTTCVERAILYHKAVVLAGEKAYQSAQDAACEWEDCCKGK